MVVRKIFCGMNFKKQGFTLSEVLIAIVIVGVIAGLVLPILLTHFQEKALEHAYTREVNAIADAVSALSVAENTSSFFETMMYENEPTEDYSTSSGLFMKKYLRIAKDCGNSNGKCFAKKYYEYKDKTKADYTPEYKGYCASLKNGVSICMTPQTGGADITGIMDLNGPKAPNILGRDLRYFTIDPKYKSAIDRTADDVIAEDPYLVTPKEPECSSCDCDPKFCPPTNACDANPNGIECCQTRAGSIASPSDPCCSYPAIKSVQSICKEPTPPCTSCSCNPAYCTTPPAEPETPANGGGGGGPDPCQINPTSIECCRTKDITSINDACCVYEEIKEKKAVCNLPVVHVTCHIKKLVLDGDKYYAEFDGYTGECRTSGVRIGVEFSFEENSKGDWVTVHAGPNCGCPGTLSGKITAIPHQPPYQPKPGGIVVIGVYPVCRYGPDDHGTNNYCTGTGYALRSLYPFEKHEYTFPHKDPTY